MRGGKRKGSGRPKLEPTKVIRVPIGCLKDVTEIINRYRMKSVTEIKDNHMKVVTETKDNHMKVVTETKDNPMKVVTDTKDDLMKPATETKVPPGFVKKFNRLPKRVQRGVKSDYGSLYEAYRCGLVIKGRSIFLPE